MGVGFAGLWLAARVSDTAAGAFALSNHVQIAFFLLFRIVGIGVSVVISQNLGARNRRGADDTARAALAASSWLALGVGVAVASGAAPLLKLLNAPADVMPLATPYLRLLALVLAVDAFNVSMAAVMRAHMHARDTLFTMLVIHGLHLVLCLLLMGGAGPLPALGLAGFAIAGALGRLVGVGCHLTLWRWRLQLVPRATDWWHLNWQQLRPVLRIGLPGAAENVAYRLAFLVTVSVVAGIGAQALAVHSYVIQLSYFMLVFSLAIGLACEILIGHMVGARQLHEADQMVRKSLRLGMAVSFSVALAAALAAPWLMRLFTDDPALIAQAGVLLWIGVLLETGRAFNLVVINSLRATGDARFPVAAGAVSLVVVMAGGGWLLGHVLGLGLVGVWIAYAADEWMRGLTMYIRWRRLGWVPAARATHRRIQRQRHAVD